jgi:hypothetical protein
MRKYGEGEIRLGNTLDIDDDIYSFAFITQMSDTIMDKTIDVLTGKTTKELEDEEIRERELEEIEKEDRLQEQEKRKKEFEKEAKRRELAGEDVNFALIKRIEARKERIIEKYGLRVEEEEEEEVVAVIETAEEKR